MSCKYNTSLMRLEDATKSPVDFLIGEARKYIDQAMQYIVPLLERDELQE